MLLLSLFPDSPTLNDASAPHRIIKEKGVPSIESYMYEEHEMLRRAATQCICNLVCTEEYITMMEGDNDRVKFLVLLIGEEDADTSQAAAGALAMATSISKKVCKKVRDWRREERQKAKRGGWLQLI